MKELKSYLRRSFTTSCPLKFFSFNMNKHAGNTDKSTSQQQFLFFSPELSKMKRSVELLSRETRRIDFKTASSLAVYMFERLSKQPASTFLHPYFAMRKLKYSMQDGDRNHFPNFNKLQLLRLGTNSVTNCS